MEDTVSTRHRIWVTWENQRRSRELSHHFGCALHLITYTGWTRYPKSIIHTLLLLVRTRPRVLFVQNPSMVLTAVAVAWGLVSSAFVVVDRHTTFLLNREYRLSLWLIVFKALHRFTLRYADLTIVTNDHLAELVSRGGGRPYVLQDKLPEIRCTDTEAPGPGRALHALLISSFGADEPIQAAVEAAARVGSSVHMFVSGNPKKAPEGLIGRAPENVTFTGFLPEKDYIGLLCGVDVVLVLTTADYTLLCGCYEALAAGKPLITSDKPVLREYFEAAVFVQNTAASIASALDALTSERAEVQKRVIASREELHRTWLERAQALDDLISDRA